MKASVLERERRRFSLNFLTQVFPTCRLVVPLWRNNGKGKVKELRERPTSSVNTSAEFLRDVANFLSNFTIPFFFYSQRGQVTLFIKGTRARKVLFYRSRQVLQV